MTVMNGDTDARDELNAIVSEMAAATEMPSPELSSADGASAVPEPPWPASLAWPSAAPRSAVTCSLTEGPSASPSASASSSPGAPAADAVDVAVAIEEPSAWIDTAPPAVRLRLVAANASWSANVSAIATPTAASSPAAPPSAVVTAEAVSSALMSAAPATSGCPDLPACRSRRRRRRWRWSLPRPARPRPRHWLPGAGGRDERVHALRVHRQVVGAEDDGVDADPRAGVVVDDRDGDRGADRRRSRPPASPAPRPGGPRPWTRRWTGPGS